jgi:hypothetical protein
MQRFLSSKFLHELDVVNIRHPSVVTYGTCAKGAQLIQCRRCFGARYAHFFPSLPFPSLSLVPITESDPSCLDSSMRGMWMPTSPSNAKVWSYRLVSYTITSPQSIMFGRHLLVSSSHSIKLGTVTSVGL